MTLAEAKTALRVDNDCNDELIESLLAALPGYIEISTGLKEADQDSEPLVKTVSGFLLMLWYYSDHADDQKLMRTINNLLKAIKVKTMIKSKEG